MNKMKSLTRRLVIEAAVIAALLSLIAGVLFFTGTFVTKAEETKTQAEGALTQDTSQLASIRSQLDRSGEAEKRYLEIQLKRTNADFASSTDALKVWARDAKQRYRFASNFKLNLPAEQKSTKPELTGVEYDIMVRDGITMELEAMSDVHIFSFIEDLERSAPGMARVTFVDLERRGDMQPQLFAQMVGGLAPPLVTARVQFSWIGVNPKPAPLLDPSALTGTPAPAPGVIP